MIRPPTETDPNDRTLWRTVPGFDGYEASSDGQIRSWWSPEGRRTMPRILSGTLNQDGYIKMTIRPPGQRPTTKLRSHFVCSAFHGTRPAGLVCCHCDGSRTNDRPENLRWDTQKANIADKETHGTKLVGERHSQAKLSEAQAREILAAKGTAPAWVVGARYGVKKAAVQFIWNGRSWTHIRAEKEESP